MCKAIVLRPHRKLDARGAAKLRKKLEQVAHGSEFHAYKSWIVDLAEVKTLDHLGLLTLIQARRFALQTGHSFYLRNLNNSVQSLLQVALLSQDFEIWEKGQTIAEKSIDLSTQLPIADKKADVTQLAPVADSLYQEAS